MKTILLAALLFSNPAIAKDKSSKAYPEHGTVVGIRVGANQWTTRIYTDSHGKTHGGISREVRTQTYRIETDSLMYELTKEEENPRFSVGDSLWFRIEKQSAYVRDGTKEQKYSVTATEKKSPKL